MGKWDEQQRQNERDYQAGRMKGADIPTMAGQAGRNEWLAEQVSSRSFPSPSGTSRDTQNPSISNLTSVKRRGGDASPSPMFTFVDTWIEGISKKWYFALSVIGAIGGYGYGLESLHPDDALLYAIGGGVAGLVLIPLLTVAIKLVLLALVLGGIGLAIYTIYALFLAH